MVRMNHFSLTYEDPETDLPVTVTLELPPGAVDIHIGPPTDRVDLGPAPPETPIVLRIETEDGFGDTGVGYELLRSQFHSALTILPGPPDLNEDAGSHTFRYLIRVGGVYICARNVLQVWDRLLKLPAAIFRRMAELLEIDEQRACTAPGVRTVYSRIPAPTRGHRRQPPTVS